MRLPVEPPVTPMLAKAVPTIPEGPYWYEPKWDGFRAIVFRDGDDIVIGSRNERPLTRYFPELVMAFAANLPLRCVLDGEIVIVSDPGDRLDFEALQQRIHPAQSRIERLAGETPASFVAFDLLSDGDTDLSRTPFQERRSALETALVAASAPVHVTPGTLDVATARDWFDTFEGAGLDGIVAKRLDGVYQQNKRVMAKIKHDRTADCVVAGYRTHKTGDDKVGSLLLGLYEGDELVSVGVIGAFPAATRVELFKRLQPLVTTFEGHPWAYARQEEGKRTPRNAEGSRWSGGKDLSFTPLEPSLVVEVAYDHMEGVRFRHNPRFRRWRPDRDAASCTFDQLERPIRYDLSSILDT